MARAAKAGAVPADVAARADELATQIRYHRERYYRDDEPEVSDAEFDVLVRELQALAEEHPELDTADSPLEEVGAPPSATFAPGAARRRRCSRSTTRSTARSSRPGTRASSG